MKRSEDKDGCGSVVLIGAGSGDPGLITVKGMESLQQCDVLVYDNLMADEFIAMAGEAEKIFVGKSSGRHALPQDEINQLLVEKAQAGARVVRLKGGDSFVFGRGGEECKALKEAGVPYEVVPGVTAGIAGSAYAGIPVTHRELSRGVTLLTAHFAKNSQVELPWDALAGLDHTLVFYMSVASLERVSDSLIAAGMDPQTPAALLERATTGAQREVFSNLAEISRAAKEQGVRPPAILVVGEVVTLGADLSWLPERPLAGRGVMFTRASESQYDAVHHLRELGAEVLDVPVVSAVPRKHDHLVRAVLAQLDEYACIAFTSALGVDIFFKAMYDEGMDVRRLARLKLAAASPTVIKALRARGVVADITPEHAGAGQLVNLLGQCGLAAGSKILLPRSSAADDSLPRSLSMAGFIPEPLAVYDSKPADLSWLEVKLANWTPDAICFLSGTGVRTILTSLPQFTDPENHPLFACVGAKTAKSLTEFGLAADLLPEHPDVDGMVEVLIERLSTDQRII